MSAATDLTTRYFISYTGVKLPLKPVNELGADETDNRNTFFRCHYDGAGRLVHLEKIVYGELELQHLYEYRADGSLQRATITDADEETTVLDFDESGSPLN